MGVKVIYKGQETLSSEVVGMLTIAVPDTDAAITISSLVGPQGPPGTGGDTAVSVAIKTTDYTITGSDDVILGDATSAAINITLPTAVGVTKIYSVKKIDSTSNTVTVVTTGGQTIDGSTTAVIKVRYVSISVVSNNSNWNVI